LPDVAEHPLREELHNELHARPSLYFDGDADVWHLAMLTDRTSMDIVDRLPNLQTLSASQQGTHGIGIMGGSQLKWELHTEFVTFTLVKPPNGGQGAPPPSEFFALRALEPGNVIAAVRVLVRDETDTRCQERPRGDFVASQVGGRDAEVHSNFRLNEHRILEFLLFNRNLNAYRKGRMVRRLLEIETYRMMALLAMPVAKESVARIHVFDQRMRSLVMHMQNASKVDKALLADMTRLSSEVLSFSADARQRFGATSAYAEIVASRLRELREEHVEQRQRIGTFIDRRFQPAMHSVRATSRRLGELAEGVRFAGDLLRTTIQVQLEDQNASLLSSMEERARVQTHIQLAVEGLSVIAITYYTVGLLKIFLDGLSGLGLEPHLAKVALLPVLPLVLFGVWRAVRHIRHSIVGCHQ
jgi:uncharacterized membrane-anchored protein